MKDAPGVKDARALFIQSGCTGVSDFAASFGVFSGAELGHSMPAPQGGYVVGRDGQFVYLPVQGPVLNPMVIAHPTRQILGSYTIDIRNNSNGTATFDLMNTMSYNSLQYHLGRKFPTGEPFGNSMLHISWAETSPCR